MSGHTGRPVAASFSSGLKLEDDAVFDNQAAGRLRFDPNASIGVSFGIGGISGGTLRNEGAIVVDGGSSSTSDIQAAFDQGPTGSIELRGGTIDLQGGGTIDGRLATDPGTNLLLSVLMPANYDLPNGAIIGGALKLLSATAKVTGQVTVSGPVFNNGTLALSPGTLDVAGDYTQGPGGKLEIGIGGRSPGFDYGQLNISGNASLAGTLDVVFLHDFEPDAGDAFKILQATTRTGDFTSPPISETLPNGQRLHSGWDDATLWLDVGFVVTNTNDKGHGSLRYVLDQVNLDDEDGHDDVTFDDSTQGPQPISLQSSLPPLRRDDVTITGLSTTTISGPDDGDALTISGSDDAIDTLTIEFAGEYSGGAGISITGHDNRVTRTHIESCGVGIRLSNTASNNTIGGTADEGNVITLNQGDGIDIEGEGTSGNIVAGNRIGDDVFGNFGDGVFIGDGATNNSIGVGIDQGNVISNNWGDGIDIEGDGTSGNAVVSNFIGTDPFGQGAEPNGSDGIFIGDGAFANRVTGNLCSSNGGAGIEVSGEGTSFNLVDHNVIGTNLFAQTFPAISLPNLRGGVWLNRGATNNTIGPVNVIAGNSDGPGVVISGPATTKNIVEGNDIGTTPSGAANVGNQQGVLIDDGASGNTIGGTAAGAGNLIADNLAQGVVVGHAATGNAILGNTIFANAGIGIDLGNDGVTANDSVGHAGPNLDQDFPVLTSAVSTSGGTIITGTVHGPANSTLRVELYSSQIADASGYGQGQTLLGVVAQVTTDGVGNGSFTFTASSPLAQGVAVSATAIDAGGNTSEFARAVPVVLDPLAQIRIARSGIVFNRFTGVYTQTITLTNLGATTVAGPIQVDITGLTPGVTLINPSGILPDGTPYIMAGGSLPPGDSITITLQFKKPSLLLYIDYVARLYPGSFV